MVVKMIAKKANVHYSRTTTGQKQQNTPAKADQTMLIHGWRSDKIETTDVSKKSKLHSTYRWRQIYFMSPLPSPHPPRFALALLNFLLRV